MEECGDEGGRDGNGAVESGGKGLTEMDLGMDGGLLLKEAAAEVGGIGGGVGAVYG